MHVVGLHLVGHQVPRCLYLRQPLSCYTFDLRWWTKTRTAKTTLNKNMERAITGRRSANKEKQSLMVNGLNNRVLPIRVKRYVARKGPWDELPRWQGHVLHVLLSQDEVFLLGLIFDKAVQLSQSVLHSQAVAVAFWYVWSLRVRHLHFSDGNE